MKRQRYVVGYPGSVSAEKAEQIKAEIAAHFNADPSDVIVFVGSPLTVSSFEVDGLEPLPKPVKEEPKADAPVVHAQKSKGKE